MEGMLDRQEEVTHAVYEVHCVHWVEHRIYRVSKLLIHLIQLQIVELFG